jgi:hypothetical protein
MRKLKARVAVFTGQAMGSDEEAGDGDEAGE